MKKVAIIGAGASGASLAWLLSSYNKEDLSVTVFDSKSEAGGCIKSIRQAGYLAESGPNGILASRRQAVELFDKARLTDVEYSGDLTTRRYIQMDGTLHLAPLGPLSALTTPLLSFGAKIRLLKEPFVKSKPDDKDESVWDFAARRVGNEAADNLVATMVRGIYAGDASKLSIRSAFPKLCALESSYGSIVKGMLKKGKEAKNAGEKRVRDKNSSKLISSTGGMQGLVKALAENAEGVNFLYDTPVSSIKRDGDFYLVDTDKGEGRFDAVALCCNAHDAAILVKGFDEELHAAYSKVKFAPVFMSAMGFSRSDIIHKLDGFGYLVMPKDKGMVLGCLFSSTLFENRAPENKALLTTICVGDMNRDYLKYDDKILEEKSFNQIEAVLGLKSSPDIIISSRSERAIPQYYVGHEKIAKVIVDFENHNSGFFSAGNTIGGISVSDCISTSINTAEKIISLLY